MYEWFLLVLIEVITEARHLTRTENVVQNAQVAIAQISDCVVSITQVAKILGVSTRLRFKQNKSKQNKNKQTKDKT